jgi:peptide/nickel transport system permease protein
MSDSVVSASPTSNRQGTRLRRSGRKRGGPLANAVMRFSRNRGAVIALMFLVVLVIAAIFAPWFTKDPTAVSSSRLQGPSVDNWLGTDDLGRDLFSRLVFGTRVALRVAIQVVVLALAVALPVGLMAGYAGGWSDYVIGRVVEALASLPALVLALTIVAVRGAGLNNAILAISVVLIPTFVRLIRAETMAVRAETFVEASRSVGTRGVGIVVRRVLPNIASPLIVQVSIAMGVALLAEAALSYLGLGVQAPAPSWGSMLRRAFDYIYTEPYQMLPPGLMIAAAVLAFNVVGDGVRDALGRQFVRVPRRDRVPSRMGITPVIGDTTAAKRGSTARASDATTPAPVSSTPVPLLSVDGLTVRITTEAGTASVVEDITFDVAPSEVVGLVGESGSGKSVTSLGIMRLIPHPPGAIVAGRVMFDGVDLTALEYRQLCQIRGRDIAMVFQDPMSSLNPAFTIGNQLIEAVRGDDSKVSAREARERAVDALAQVGIPDPASRVDDYPHNLSGGMRQRVMIAMALINRPKLLIADEPTTALDVTIQAEILALLKRLQVELGMSIILVTHDLGVVADICDRVVVMYAGQIVERGPVEEIFARPRHPYTAALLGSMPQTASKGSALPSIPGVVPSPFAMPRGCRFRARCSFATAECQEPIEVTKIGIDRESRCYHHATFASAEPRDAATRDAATRDAVTRDAVTT